MMDEQKATLAEIKQGARVQAVPGGQVPCLPPADPGPGDPAPTPPETDDHVQVLYPPPASQHKNALEGRLVFA